MIIQLSVILAVLSVLAESQRSYRPTFVRRLARCSLPTKPCRLRVGVSTLTGGNLQSSSTPMCSCNYPYRCPDDWTRTQNYVARQLQSTDFNVTLDMMFCGPIMPRRLCNPGEGALVVSGYLSIPTDLESYNCRCPDDSPLRLQLRSLRNFKYYHTYVCASHFETCDAQQQNNCSSIGQTESRYFCSCPGTATCHTTNQRSNGARVGICQE